MRGMRALFVGMRALFVNSVSDVNAMNSKSPCRGRRSRGGCVVTLVLTLDVLFEHWWSNT